MKDVDACSDARQNKRRVRLIGITVNKDILLNFKIWSCWGWMGVYRGLRG